MEKRFVCLFVFVCLFGVVFAATGWGDINNEDGREIVPVVESSADDYQGLGDIEDVSSGSGDGTYFTEDFYIALALIIFILIVVGVAVWLFLRGPRNKWER